MLSGINYWGRIQLASGNFHLRQDINIFSSLFKVHQEDAEGRNTGQSCAHKKSKKLHSTLERTPLGCLLGDFLPPIQARLISVLPPLGPLLFEIFWVTPKSLPGLSSACAGSFTPNTTQLSLSGWGIPVTESLLAPGHPAQGTSGAAGMLHTPVHQLQARQGMHKQEEPEQEPPPRLPPWPAPLVCSC